MFHESAKACPKITTFLLKHSDCEAAPTLKIENELSSQGRVKSNKLIDEHSFVKEFPETILNSHNVESISEQLPEPVSSTSNIKPHLSQETVFFHRR